MTEAIYERDATIHDFQATLHGTLIQPGDPTYDAARTLWNGRIDKHPALIVHCANVADVVASVRFATTHDLPISVRGGGHGVAGKAICDDGVVVDLLPMKNIVVDPVARTARVEGGVTSGEFVNATLAHGLIATVGSHSSVGLAGLTIGGGYGFLMGKYGLTCDSLLSVELVTADGTIRYASTTDNADLFWAMRGGGANFGIVITLTFQLQPMEPILAGFVAYPLNRATEVLQFYREFSYSAPDNLTAYAVMRTEPQRAMPIIFILARYVGPLDGRPWRCRS